MNEHDIFLAALEIADPSQRAEYLHRTCAGDEALRRQVESLLAAHDRSGEFLDTPALRQVAARVAQEQRAADFTSAETGGTEEIDLSFLQPSAVPGSLGRLGHYEIQEVIGQGGAGIVLKAFDEMLRRVVAIKVMAPELAATSPARKRFLREARAAAAIRHDNVISIYNVEEQPIPFLVMEHIAGQTLQQRLDTTGPLHTEEVVRLGQQIARGLEAAHALGLIHRDIKPGNILLEPESNRVKITDFGLARTADDASITQSGVIAGTPLYMSPEQARGEALDQRSDLFSLGSVLYVMCSGRPPFRAATTLAVLRRVAEDQPRPIREIIPEVPAWLTAIIDRLHAKKAADRFGSAKAVAEVLGRCLAELQQKGRVEAVDNVGSAVSQEPVPDRQDRQERTPAVTATRPPRRRRLAAAAVLLALFVGLGLTEATSVTNIRGTVIRLLSPDGALVVEVDDPGVSVSIDGEEMVITGTGAKEIRLKPGLYKVFASKDGKVVSQELVTVTKNGRQVVRISREARLAVTDPDRNAAEWVLRDGGQVTILADQPETKLVVEALKDLPTGAFKLISIHRSPGLRRLAPAELEHLRTLENLRELRLGRADLTDPDLANLAKFPGTVRLEVVWMNAPAVTDQGLAALRSLRLRHLALQKMPQITAAGVRNLAGMAGLTELGLTERAVSAEVLAALEALPGLSGLDLSGTRMSGESLKSLARVTKLRGLNLAGVPLTSEALAHVGSLQGLQVLALNESPVDDRGLEDLKGLATLRLLHLEKTKVTRVGVEQLAATLQSCKIGWDGGVIEPKVNPDPDRRAADWVLSIGGTVTISVLGRGEITVSRAKELPLEPFFLIDTNGLHRNNFVTDNGLANLRGCNLLKGIHINSDQVTDAGLAHLREVATKFKYLIVHCPQVTDAGLAQFENCRDLENLTLGGPNITDAGITAFKNCRKLQALVAPSTQVTAAGLAHFRNCTDLRTLNLSGSKITDAALAHFWNCKDLVELSLHNALVTDEGLAFLADCKALQTLGLANTLVTDGVLTHLKPCAKLKKLDLRNTRLTDNGLDAAREMLSLSTFMIPGTKVSEARVKKLAAALPTCRIEWDGGVIEPKVNLDPDRKAAEYVLSIGGILRVNEEERDIKDAAVLPNEAFRLTRVDLQNNQQVNDAGLACFKDCKNLTTLYLHSTQVSDAGLAHFKGCKNLTHLVLQGTQVSDVGLAHFKGCNNLSYFSLGGTKVSDAGLVNFKECKKLTVLHLGDTKVSDAGLAHFKDCNNLTTLNLSATQVSDAGLPHFKDCKNLTQLSLNGTLVSDAGLAHFKECKKLTVLQLGSTKLSDAGLAHFKDCKNLTILNLQITQVSDVGLAHFKDCNNLKTLNLYDTKVSDAGLAYFKECKKLTQLILQNTQVSDAGLAHFKDCKTLTFVGLQKTKVTAAKIKELQKTLPQCKIEWDGGVIEPQVNFDPDRKAAEYVLSVGGKVEANGYDRWIAMQDDLPARSFMLTRADMTACKAVTDAGLACFEGCKNLTFIVLSFTKVGDAGLAHFKDCKSLLHLRLDRTQAGDAGLVHFKDCRDLTYLWLDRTQVSDGGLVHLKDCKNLSLLSLEGTPVSDAGLVHIKDCTKLATLNLTATQVGDAGMMHFKNCKNLTSISLNRTKVGDAGLAHFKDCSNLTQLSLQGTAAGDAGLAHFKNCNGLTTLWLNRTRVSDAGLAHFKDCKNLLHLSLEETRVSDTGLAHFKDCTKLVSLDLTATQVSDAGLAHFKGCTKLVNLSLERTQVGDAGLAHFKDCKSLNSLQLGGTGLSDAGLDIVRDMPSVSVLTVQGTKATREGVKKLAATRPDLRIMWGGGTIEPKVNLDPDRKAAEYVLSVGGKAKVKVAGREQNVEDAARLPSEPFQLSYVHLMSNRKVDDDGLANLRGCQHIRWLDIRGTLVTDAGLVHLKDCANLETLWLGENLVTDAGLVYFKECKRLTNLALPSTQVTDAGLTHFKDCKYLTTLVLGKTKISDAGLAHFKDCRLLENLNLYETSVTDAGLAHFKDCKNLTHLNLYGTKLSDVGLAHFKGCNNLKFLQLQKTKVTVAKIKELQKTLPLCKIEWDGGVVEPSTTPD